MVYFIVLLIAFSVVTLVLGLNGMVATSPGNVLRQRLAEISFHELAAVDEERRAVVPWTVDDSVVFDAMLDGDLRPVTVAAPDLDDRLHCEQVEQRRQDAPGGLPGLVAEYLMPLRRIHSSYLRECAASYGSPT